jgi:hypothetical protein
MGQRVDQSASSHSSVQNLPQKKLNPTRGTDRKNKPAVSQITTQTAGMVAVMLPAQTKTNSRLPDELRRRMIEEAAYYRAEKRGFSGGDDVQDWLAAEAEINASFPG